MQYCQLCYFLSKTFLRLMFFNFFHMIPAYCRFILSVRLHPEFTSKTWHIIFLWSVFFDFFLMVPVYCTLWKNLHWTTGKKKRHQEINNKHQNPSRSVTQFYLVNSISLNPKFPTKTCRIILLRSVFLKFFFIIPTNSTLECFNPCKSLVSYF